MDALLDLPGYKVLEKQETDHDLRFTVEWEAENLLCLHCGSLSAPYKHGVLPQVVMDMPIRGKRVGLTVNAQRYRCRDCGKTSMQNVGWLDLRRAATLRLVQYIQTESLKRTFTSIAYDVGLSEAAIRSIFKDHVRFLASTIHFQTPEWLGMDELKLMKKTRGIITNVKERTVVDMLSNRDLTTIRGYLWKLPDKERVQVVAMDMWHPYRMAVQEILPAAQIVVDKFHVVRMATDAMDSVRKSIREGLKPNQRRTLMHDRFILFRRARELKQSDLTKRDAWFGTFPSLQLAYWLKEEYYDLWDAKTGEEAAALYDEWAAKIPKEMKPAFQPLITSMTNWRAEIFAHFDYGRVTNAYTEAVNGMAKLIARNGRGYSFEAVRAKVLYGNGLKMNERPKYDKRKQWGDRLAFTLDDVVNPQPVELTHYDTLGNDISTWVDEWEGFPDELDSTS
jgi:transposase